MRSREGVKARKSTTVISLSYTDFSIFYLLHIMTGALSILLFTMVPKNLAAVGFQSLDGDRSVLSPLLVPVPLLISCSCHSPHCLFLSLSPFPVPVTLPTACSCPSPHFPFLSLSQLLVPVPLPISRSCHYPNCLFLSLSPLLVPVPLPISCHSPHCLFLSLSPLPVPVTLSFHNGLHEQCPLILTLSA